MGSVNIINQTDGDVIAVNSAGNWANITAGAVSSIFQSGGLSSSPFWGATSALNITAPAVSALSDVDVSGLAQGDVIYRNSASKWTNLPPGTSGRFLKTGGAAANPSWSSIAASSVQQVIYTDLTGATTSLGVSRGAVALVSSGKRLAFYDGGTTLRGRYTNRPSVECPFSVTTTQSGALTITPNILTRVEDGATEYILATSTSFTGAYHYDIDFTNETSVSFSGTGILSGARRIGYGGTNVWIQDGANDASTVVRKYTFSGSTLTNVADVTLGTAPSDTASNGKQIIETATYILFFDTDGANAQTIKVYNKTTGTQVDSFTFADGENMVGLLHKWDEETKAYIVKQIDTAGTAKVRLVPFNYEV